MATDLRPLRRIARRYGLCDVVMDPTIQPPRAGYLVRADWVIALRPDLPFWAHVFLVYHEIGHVFRLLEATADPAVAAIYDACRARVVRQGRGLPPDPRLERIYWEEEARVNLWALEEMRFHHRHLTTEAELATVGLCCL